MIDNESMNHERYALLGADAYGMRYNPPQKTNGMQLAQRRPRWNSV